MQEFIHKHHRKIFTINAILFGLSLLVLLFSTSITSIGDNNITGLMQSDIKISDDYVEFFQHIIYPVSLTIFALNLLATLVMLKTYKPEKYLVGYKITKYNSNQKIVKSFTKQMLKTHSKLTDNDYTLLLLDRMIEKKKKRNPLLKLISLKHGKGNQINIEINKDINEINDKQLRQLLNLFLEQLSVKYDSEKDPFRILLKYNMELDLLKTLESKEIRL